MAGPARRLAAVIFDFDGLLADSEGLHERAWLSILSARGIDVTESEYRRHFIRTGRSIADLLEERGLAIDLDALRAEKLAFHLGRIRAELRAMPGALDLLRSLEGRTRLALATSGARSHLEPGLAHLGMQRFFECVATRECVPRPKPHPDLFLHVACELGVEPSRCVVLEDAEKGVVAALAAGMSVVAVPTSETADNDFSRATLVVRSLAEVTFDALDGLLRRRSP